MSLLYVGGRWAIDLDAEARAWWAAQRAHPPCAIDYAIQPPTTGPARGVLVIDGVGQAVALCYGTIVTPERPA